jgi:hypothetical protein
MVTRSDGNHHVRYDTVCRTYNKIRKRLTEIPNKSLKFLRKTGSTRLRSDSKYMLLDQLYLGHSHKSVADKHYNAFDGDPYPPLDEAITWLGKEFGVLR